MDPEQIRRACQKTQKWAAWKQESEDQTARTNFQRLVLDLHRELEVQEEADEWERELLSAWDEARRRYRHQVSPREALVQLLQRTFEDYEVSLDEARSLQDQPMHIEFLADSQVAGVEQEMIAADAVDPVGLAEDIVAGKAELENANEMAAAGAELAQEAQNRYGQSLRNAVEFYRNRKG